MSINIAFIGLGQRGNGLLGLYLTYDDVNITAVCDSYEDRTRAAADRVEAAKGKRPFETQNYMDIFDGKKADAVVIASSWEGHIDISIAAMNSGIITGMEVGGAYTYEDCVNLVKTYEKTKTPFMFLENCCYGKEELLGTSLVRNGVLGEVVHCEGAYAHDLRTEILGGNVNRHYRLRNYINRNRESYPTHELGPIAKLLNINRGNRMTSLVSVASKSAGLRTYIDEHKDTVDQTLLNQTFKQGDIVTTVVTCENGETILMKLDTTLPRFYSRNFTVRGTKGFYEQDTHCVFVENNFPEYWDTVESYKHIINNAVEYEKKYLPDIWRNITPEQLAAGHGGMDSFVSRAFIDCAKNGDEMPIDVYDGVAWMAVSYLSEQSVANSGAPVEIPDFTTGAYKTRMPKDVVQL